MVISRRGEEEEETKSDLIIFAARAGRFFGDLLEGISFSNLC
jgi:hypothetical protein